MKPDDINQDPGVKAPSGDDKDQKPVIGNLRTFTSDLAELVNSKKLSGKEMSSIDPETIQAIKEGRYSENLVSKTPLRPGEDDFEVDPITKQMMEAGVMKHGERTIDLDEEKRDKPVNWVDKNLGQLPKERNVDEAFEIPAGEALDLKGMQPVVKVPEKKGGPQPLSAPVAPVVKAPEPIVKKEPTPAEKLKSEELELQNELKKIEDEKMHFEKTKESLAGDKTKNKTALDALKTKESDIEKSELEMWQQEKVAGNAADRHSLEQKRWSVEDERQRIEKERWSIDQHIESIEKQIQTIDKEESQLDKKHVSSEKQLDTVKKKEAALQAESEKPSVLKKFEDVKKERLDLESHWKDLIAKKKEFEKIEADALKQESGLASEISAIEAKEHKATNPSEIHEHEEERWKKEQSLREVEQNTWKTESDVAGADKMIAEIEQKSQGVLVMEKSLKNKIAELDALIASVEEKKAA